MWWEDGLVKLGLRKDGLIYTVDVGSIWCVMHDKFILLWLSGKILKKEN